MGNRFTLRLHNLPGKDLTGILSKVATVDEFKGWWKGTSTLNPQALGRLKRSIVVTSTGASTRIEGSRLTDRQVEKLLKGLGAEKLTDRDSQEVAGYADLLQTVFDSYRDIPFTEGTILQFHRELLKYSDKDEPRRGRYKSSSNKVVAVDRSGRELTLFNPTEPHLVQSEMRDLMEWTKGELKGEEFHPVLVVANFIVEFLAIHPFHDGNGRLSRILTNLLLAQVGYAYMPYASLEKIIEDNKAEYYVSLRTAQKGGKSPKAQVGRWVHFFMDVMVKQIGVLREFLKTAPMESLLSTNQQDALGLFEKHEEISTRLVAKELRIPAVTAKQTLRRLLELKMVQQLGVGRTTRYRKSGG